MQQETFESLLIKHPEVQTLKVKFSGFNGEGMNDYVDLYDHQGHMIDADIGTALDKIADYGADLMVHAMERAGMDGIQDNEGGAVSVTFEITRDEEGVSILAASDHVERFYTESTEQDVSRCKLLYHGERMEPSGESMAGSRYQIKGDEVYDIKDLDDCLDGGSSLGSLSPSV